MGFQELAEGRLRSRYERLTTDDVKAARPRRSWVKKMNGRLKGLRLSSSLIPCSSGSGVENCSICGVFPLPCSLYYQIHSVKIVKLNFLDSETNSRFCSFLVAFFSCYS
ncbi:unnamed protein product, partial [Vitis vinifera]